MANNFPEVDFETSGKFKIFPNLIFTLFIRIFHASMVTFWLQSVNVTDSTIWNLIVCHAK